MLIFPFKEISHKIFVDHGYFGESEKQGKVPLWRDWIFAETGYLQRVYDGEYPYRSTCATTDASTNSASALSFLIDMLIDIDIGAHQSGCAGFDAVPLPCSKDMWTAVTRSAWDEQYRKYLDDRNQNTTMTFGDLRHSQHLQTQTIDTQLSEGLVAWCKTIDDFGSVIMMAAGISS